MNQILDTGEENLRKKVNDAKLSLPLGTLPSIVLDDYGSVYGMFLAVTSDGYTHSELQKYTEYIDYMDSNFK